MRNPPAPALAPAVEQPVGKEAIVHALREKQKVSLPSSVCPYCGSTIVSNAIICLKCGRNLRSGRKLYDTPAPAPWGPLLKSLLALLVVIAAAVFLIWYAPDYLGKWFHFGGRGEAKDGAALTTTDPAAAPDETAGGPAVAADRTGRGNRLRSNAADGLEAAPAGDPKADHETAVKAHDNAPRRKAVTTQSPCPKCEGRGFTVSSFGHSQRTCLTCGGDGKIATVNLVDAAP